MTPAPAPTSCVRIEPRPAWAAASAESLDWAVTAVGPHPTRLRSTPDDPLQFCGVPELAGRLFIVVRSGLCTRELEVRAEARVEIDILEVAHCDEWEVHELIAPGEGS